MKSQRDEGMRVEVMRDEGMDEGMGDEGMSDLSRRRGRVGLVKLR